MTQQSILQARQMLLAWHRENKRILPWDGESDPYRVWLSEIMLQQTRTETVKEYYHRFLQACPTVCDLAAADEETVFKLWEGLGYYSRARNLQKAAKIVANDLHGVFPDTVEGLKALPGIGEYTAGAIASEAFGIPVPSIDANQYRVLSRLFATQEDKAQIFPKAQALLDPTCPGLFNQALMGLGALICLPKPKCALCPIADLCEAKAQNLTEALPVLPQKAQRRIEHRAVALVLCGEGILVRKRTEKGLLSGMWEFPNFLDARSIDDVAACLSEMGLQVRYQNLIGTAKHVFTHLEWHMTGYCFRTTDPCGYTFMDKEALREIAMPSAFQFYRKWFEAL